MNQMHQYRLSWVTTYLAAGPAPVSSKDLEAIKRHGIISILNLCMELPDLHRIESEYGFNVYFLPVADECAPDLAPMEEALNWIDHELSLRKRTLIHCRHGIGRTGTLGCAYLMRKGLNMEASIKVLKYSGAHPTNAVQWKLLKRYFKQINNRKANGRQFL
jgi:protein-tyrosine phosphatase